MSNGIYITGADITAVCAVIVIAGGLNAFYVKAIVDRAILRAFKRRDRAVEQLKQRVSNLEVTHGVAQGD